jgi:hypothetical protein
MSKPKAKAKILEFIKQNGPVAILAWTDFTPDTITGALAALLESGAIVEVERGGVVMVEVSDNEN